MTKSDSPSSKSFTTADGDVACLSYELDPASIEASMRSSKSGAINQFVGYTRDNFQGRQVTRLEYEAYVPLALKAMVQILEEARNLSPPPPLEGAHPCCPPPSTSSSVVPTSITTRPHSHSRNDSNSPTSLAYSSKIEINRIHLSHLLGPSPPLNPSIVISVASPHRREAFWLTEWLLERVKERVPVWKREYYADVDEAFVGRDGDGPEGKGGRSRAGNGDTGEIEEGRWKENFKAEKVVRIEKLP